MCVSAGPSSTRSKQLPQLSHFAFCIQASVHNQKEKSAEDWRTNILTEQQICGELELTFLSLTYFWCPLTILLKICTPHLLFMPVHIGPPPEHKPEFVSRSQTLWFPLADLPSVMRQGWLSSSLDKPVLKLQEGCASTFWLVRSKILAEGPSKSAYEHPSAHPIIQLPFQPSQKAARLLEGCPHR